jgi:exodeoxyribonuclease-5
MTDNHPTTPGEALTSSPIVLDSDQDAAVRKIAAWHRAHDPRSSRPFRLFGYAGTGKSTIVTRIVDELGLTGSVAYAAFSGKAADVMRRKGCDGAQTIHSLIYKPQGESARQLALLLDSIGRDRSKWSSEAATIVRRLQHEVDNPEFVLRDDDPLDGVGLLVIDEVSMVDERTARDLLSLGAPTLVLGDPGQLPPPYGAGYFMTGTPDVQLTRVHRAAEAHPITRMATAIRNSADGEPGYGATERYDNRNGRFNGVRADLATT